MNKKWIVFSGGNWINVLDALGKVKVTFSAGKCAAPKGECGILFHYYIYPVTLAGPSFDVSKSAFVGLMTELEVPNDIIEEVAAFCDRLEITVKGVM